MITEVSTTDKTFETQKIFEKLETIIKFFQKSLNSNIWSVPTFHWVLPTIFIKKVTI